MNNAWLLIMFETCIMLIDDQWKKVLGDVIDNFCETTPVTTYLVSGK